MSVRRLTIILSALTVAAVQTHAGILDWLRGSPAKGSSADPVASFERGIARLREHRNQIFHTSGKIDITYDVKKTDSLIEPVVGIISIVDESGYYKDLRLTFRDGSWVITSFIWRLPDADPIHIVPHCDEWNAIQACFVTDEAVETAVASTPASTPANSEVGQPQPAANRVLDNGIRAFENRDYSKAASCFDELSQLATDSDLKSKALSVSNALRRLAETNSEADAQEVLAAVKALRSSTQTSSSTLTSSSPLPATPSDSTATETTVPLQVEKELEPPPGYIMLNREVEIRHGTNKIVIPKGSQLWVVSRTEHAIGVRFQGQFEIIPKSAVTESK